MDAHEVDACVMTLLDLLEERAEQGVKGILLPFLTTARVSKRLGAPVDLASLTLALRRMKRAGYFVLREIDLPSIEHYHRAGLLTTGEATVLRAHQQRSAGALPDSYIPSHAFVVFTLTTTERATGRTQVVPFWLAADYSEWDGGRSASDPLTHLRSELTQFTPDLFAHAPIEYRCARCQATVARGAESDGGAAGAPATPVQGGVAYGGAMDARRVEPVLCACCHAVVGEVAEEGRHDFDAARVQPFRIPLSISVL